MATKQGSRERSLPPWKKIACMRLLHRIASRTRTVTAEICLKDHEHEQFPAKASLDNVGVRLLAT